MGYFPFFADIAGKEFLIVGAGRTALGKVEKLIPFEPEITVVAPQICPEFEKLGVKLIRRSFQDSDLEDKFAVIAATDDSELNGHISELCRAVKIPVNVVDDKEKCSFIFPALSGGRGVTVGITTSGQSPALARYIREKNDEFLTERLMETVELLGSLREEIKLRITDESRRKQANEQFLRLCIEGECLPDREKLDKLINRLESDYENKNRNKAVCPCNGSDGNDGEKNKGEFS